MNAIQYLALAMITKFFMVTAYLVGFVFLALGNTILYFILFGTAAIAFMVMIMFDMIFIYKAIKEEK